MRSRYATGSSPALRARAAVAAVDARARGIVRAVAAVGARGQQRHAVPAFCLQCERQRKLLVPAAHAGAAHRDRGLAAAEQTAPLPRLHRVQFGARGLRQKCRRVARLALQRSADRPRRKPELPGLVFRRGQRLADAGDDHVTRVRQAGIAGLDGLGPLPGAAAPQMIRDARRQLWLQAVFRDHRLSPGKGGVVRRGRSRTDHVQRVADHVGEDQRQQLCRVSRLRQPAALHRREMFAHRVQLVDRRARVQQQPGRILFVLQGDVCDRRDQQRRRAAGEQADDQRPFIGAAHQLQDALRAGDPRLVRHRVGGFHLLYDLQRLGVSVLDDDQSRGDVVAEQCFDGQCHPRRGFACADHDDALE